MKEYLKHNILNVEIQREDEKRLGLHREAQHDRILVEVEC